MKGLIVNSWRVGGGDVLKEETDHCMSYIVETGNETDLHFRICKRFRVRDNVPK